MKVAVGVGVMDGVVVGVGLGVSVGVFVGLGVGEAVAVAVAVGVVVEVAVGDSVEVGAATSATGVAGGTATVAFPARSLKIELSKGKARARRTARAETAARLRREVIRILLECQLRRHVRCLFHVETLDDLPFIRRDEYLHGSVKAVRHHEHAVAARTPT